MRKRYLIDKICFFILFIVVTFFSFKIVIYLKSDIYALRKKGYKTSELNSIKETLSKENIKLLTKYKYNPYVSDIVADSNYKKKKFKDYIEFYDGYKYSYNSEFILIVNDKFYVKGNKKRYIKYANSNTDYEIRNIVSDINCNLDYKYYEKGIKTDISKEKLMIVNKYYNLDKEYTPSNLVKIDSEYGVNKYIQKEVYDAFIKMNNDMKKEGLSLIFTSAYRNYEDQEKIYNSYKKDKGKEYADKYAARAGYSEHQTGYAIDLASKNHPEKSFVYTKEYDWLKDNSYKYGFVLRYPKEFEKQTGYNSESWHYRYVGKDAAKIIYDNNITFDEYYEYYVK